jgi:hypothetical protein
MPEAEKQREAEERKQLRPYRRLVGLIFALAIAVVAVFVLRGIIRRLDRLPSVDALLKPTVVDVRALRACAEDLDKLEVRIRALAGRAFSELPPEGQRAADWQALSADVELERISIVARCRLHEPNEDPVVKDLEEAANHLEALMRSYGLLYGRHEDDGLLHSTDAKRALQRAGTALKSR